MFLRRILTLLFALLSLGPSLQAGPDYKLLQTVPDVEQTTDYSCGLASLVSVLAYYGIFVSEQTLIKETKVDPEVGVAIAAIIKSATKRGLKAVAAENATLQDLEHALKLNQLTIILGQAWRNKRFMRQPIPWEDEWDAGHYMVVIGMDSSHVYFEDPWIFGVRGHIAKKEFLKRWHGPSDSDEPTQRQAIFFQGNPDPSRPALDLSSISID